MKAESAHVDREARRDFVMRVTGKTIILVDVCAVLFLLFGAETSLFWSLFLTFLFFGWDNRVMGSFAILALTACPILLSLEQPALAEQMAVYAYYLLVITVVLQIIEFKRHPEQFGEEEKLEIQRVVDLRSRQKQNL